MTKKIAPVQGYAAGIPWSMHLRAYDAYCKKWGKQPALIDLEGRNCRGGFSTRELDDFIPGWREELSEINRLKAEIEHLRTERDAAVKKLRAALKPFADRRRKHHEDEGRKLPAAFRALRQPDDQLTRPDSGRREGWRGGYQQKEASK